MKRRMAYRIITIPISMAFILASCGNGKSFYQTYSGGGQPALAIIEGVEWNSVNHVDEEGKFNVNVMIANLYYSVTYTGEIACTIAYEGSPAYSFETITVSLITSEDGDPLASYDVDTNLYTLREYGIIRDYAENAGPKDYKLIYQFDLNSLFKEDFEGRIVFLVTYHRKKDDSLPESLKERDAFRAFSFRFERNNDHFKLSDFFSRTSKKEAFIVRHN